MILCRLGLHRWGACKIKTNSQDCTRCGRHKEGSLA